MFSDFETADEAEHSARVADGERPIGIVPVLGGIKYVYADEHTHHYVPVRDGRTSQGEPQFRLVCACGTPLPSGSVTRSNDERKNDGQ
jgi:hypothetical protein